MNRLVWKLLRRHVSIGQLTGFFLANLIGMAIVLLAVQAYCDIRPVLTGGDSFLKQDYLIAGKKVGTLGSLMGKSSTFTPEEMENLRSQPFTVQVGSFTPSLFHVSAGMGIQGTGVDLSTEMFFEAVPDEFIDADLSQWHYDEATRTIPIIIPRNYLNLYNFGFAESRGLPKLSEGLTGLLRMDITLRGNGRMEHYKGQIVGFSNRLNTILIPQAFMEQANRTLAPGQEAQPSRLIVEVNNPADEAIARYFQQKGYSHRPLFPAKRLRNRRQRPGRRQGRLVPAPADGRRAGRRAGHQPLVLLLVAAQHLPAAAKERHQAGKPAAHRLQPGTSGLALPPAGRRTEPGKPRGGHTMHYRTARRLYGGTATPLFRAGGQRIAALPADRRVAAAVRRRAQREHHPKKNIEYQ